MRWYYFLGIGVVLLLTISSFPQISDPLQTEESSTLSNDLILFNINIGPIYGTRTNNECFDFLQSVPSTNISLNLVTQTSDSKLLIEETIFDIVYLKEISFILLGSIITSLGKTAYHSKLQREYSKNCELIKQTITQNPGISLRGISRSTGLAMGSTQYWIRFLEQDNEIDFKLLGKSKHYFDCHQKLSNKAILLCCLTQNSRIKEILDALLQYPELSTQKELCQYLGYNKSLLSYYIKILRNYTILHPEMKNLSISDDFKLYLLNSDYSSS